MEHHTASDSGSTQCSILHTCASMCMTSHMHCMTRSTSSYRRSAHTDAHTAECMEDTPLPCDTLLDTHVHTALDAYMGECMLRAQYESVVSGVAVPLSAADGMSFECTVRRDESSDECRGVQCHTLVDMQTVDDGLTYYGCSVASAERCRAVGVAALDGMPVSSDARRVA